MASTLGFAGSASGQVTLAFPASHRLLTLSLPDKPAAIQLDILHLRIEKNILNHDATERRLYATSGSWVVSANLSPVQAGMNAAGLREQAWDSLNADSYKPDRIRRYELGSVAVVEYMIDKFQGPNVRQKNIAAYLVSGDQKFEIRVSKLLYDPSDDQFLNSILNSMKLLERYRPDSRVEFGYGNFFFTEKNWTRASQHYEQALEYDRMQRKRGLSAGDWRTLVENLGAAYAMGKNLEKAKATFQFGITQDPGYPMFHYKLATVYAELNDLDNALIDLRSAFLYRARGIAAAGIPDPARETSFQRFTDDERFVRLSKQVCPESRETPSGYVCQ
jgi:tetratricopeptide (TPR) repeat protein